MAGNLVVLLIGRALADRRRRRKQQRNGPPPDRPPAPRDKGPGLGGRLTGQTFLLDRPGLVPRDCLALLFEPDLPVRLVPTRQYLKPPAFPFRQPVRVLVVSTAPVVLDVTVDGLVTMDGYRIERLVLRMWVQVSDHEDFRALRDRAAELGPDLEAALLDRVRLEVTAEVLGAVRMNRLADLQRRSLYELLADHWMPSWFAGRSLARRGFEVHEVRWPPRSGPEPTAEPADAPAPARPEPAADHPQSGLDLTMDARLRRLWLREGDADLRGIAGAKVDATATVIAVPGSPPGAYANHRLAELFGTHFDHRQVHLVSAVATDYDELVRAWFSQVDTGSDRLVSVQSTEDDAVLRILVDQLSAAGDGPPLRVGSQSDREALRRLLPHRKVEFVAASSD